MKKKLLMLLLVVTSLTALFAVSLTTANAVSPTYDIYVGGIQVNEDNAADVLGDGTVSYDAATNTLTLSGANITEVHTSDIFTAGIYTEIADLTIKLVGENRIPVPIHDGGMPDGSEVAIASSKSIEISGTGKLWSNTYVVTGMQDVVIKNCEISSDWICLSVMMGDVTVEDATISGKVGLIGTQTGDITLKNTNVPDGGNYVGMYTETGDITIENSDFTAHCTVVEDDNARCIMIGQGNLTVKNSKIDLSAKMFTAFVGGKVVFENVSGSLEAHGEAGYAIYADGDIEMSDCDLTISCRATADAAGGICSSSDVTIKNSSITMDIRATEDYGVGIGFPEGDSGNVTISDSILDISVTGPTGEGIASSNVKLTNCITKIEAVGNPNSDGFGVGIYATGGRAVINGGVADITATGPANGSPVSGGIIMSNELLLPEMIGADVKLRGNMAICAAPDLTLYGRDYEIVASANINGSEPVEYNKENIATYKYLHIHPFYTVTFNANGGTGEMTSETDFYGTYTLPENQFTAPEGMIFAGWSPSPDGKIIASSSFTPHADTTLYAIWEEDPSYAPEDSEETSEEELESEEESTPSNPEHTHDFGGEWKSDGDNHWKECSCGEKALKSTHSDTNANGSCDICGAILKSANGLSGGAIAGIAVGSVAVVGIGGFSIFWFAIKKKSLADLIAVFKKK